MVPKSGAWLFYRIAILSNCHFVNLPFCQLAILSTCHIFNLRLQIERMEQMLMKQVGETANL